MVLKEEARVAKVTDPVAPLLVMKCLIFDLIKHDTLISQKMIAFNSV